MGKPRTEKKWPPPPGLLDAEEIAAMLGVDHDTVHRWRTRSTKEGGTFPEPEHQLGQTPIWTKATIVKWAVRTGRMTKEGQPVKLAVDPSRAKKADEPVKAAAPRVRPARQPIGRRA